jgi:hypothetical protein
MALQIIAWMVSGLYFAIFPIEEIRGEHLTRKSHPPDPAAFRDLVPVSVAWESVREQLGPDAVPADVSLASRDGQVHFRVSGSLGDTRFERLVDGRSGAVRGMLGARDAMDAAVASLSVTGSVEQVRLVEDAPPGSEIRGRQLPVWRVDFSTPESLRLYIDPWTAEVVARRTARWRLFDFLWMLHIMDFSERDDFNTPLLQVAAAMGLIVALSGVIFWAMTARLPGRKRGARNQGAV